MSNSISNDHIDYENCEECNGLGVVSCSNETHFNGTNDECSDMNCNKGYVKCVCTDD